MMLQKYDIRFVRKMQTYFYNMGNVLYLNQMYAGKLKEDKYENFRCFTWNKKR